MDCGCEFSGVNYHGDACKLQIPLLARLEKAKQRLIDHMEFDGAAAVRDAMIFIRKARYDPANQKDTKEE